MNFVTAVRENVTAAPRMAAEQMFRLRQDGLMFSPHNKRIEPLHPPSHYEELAGIKVEEHVFASGVKQGMGLLSRLRHGTPSITVWETKPQPGKPMIIYTPGRSGHIADSGKILAGRIGEGYDRRGQLKMLRSIHERGAGFMVITPRGYGNNGGRPSEAGFKEDIETFCDHWFSRDDRPSSQNTILMGQSMGTSLTARLARAMDKRGDPAGMVVLCNPFSNMSVLSKEFIGKSKLAQAVGLDQATVDYIREKLLIHQFPTNEWISKLTPDTYMLILTSGRDELINPEHSFVLADVARKRGLGLKHLVWDEFGHINLPQARMINTLFEHHELANERMVERNNEPAALGHRLQHMRDGVFSRGPKIFTTMLDERGKGSVVQVPRVSELSPDTSVPAQVKPEQPVQEPAIIEDHEAMVQRFIHTRDGVYLKQKAFSIKRDESGKIGVVEI